MDINQAEVKLLHNSEVLELCSALVTHSIKVYTGKKMAFPILRLRKFNRKFHESCTVNVQDDIG